MLSHTKNVFICLKNFTGWRETSYYNCRLSQPSRKFNHCWCLDGMVIMVVQTFRLDRWNRLNQILSLLLLVQISIRKFKGIIICTVVVPMSSSHGAGAHCARCCTHTEQKDGPWPKQLTGRNHHQFCQENETDAALATPVMEIKESRHSGSIVTLSPSNARQTKLAVPIRSPRLQHSNKYWFVKGLLMLSIALSCISR